MENGFHPPIAVVGLGAILPDAPNVPSFWENVKKGRYSITEVSPNRWDPALYYDPDPAAPDKAYSKIGGWVGEFPWDPMQWHLPIPPRVANSMDDGQKWAIACTREALDDYGYPERPLDLERTAVIVGNAMGGEHHYLTALRIYFPEYARELAATTSFAALPTNVRQTITDELHERISRHLPDVTEDTMPGELSNCIAGRIANLFNMRGPNFVTDAACASAMAAINAAAEGLIEQRFDAVITGGIDRNMGASSFIKFCKIGALSATGSRPYAEGADGFVMGEGAAVFLMKRLADAERDQDRIYAVLRGIGGSSDGKGKGITAPNPIGQKLCMERAWKNAGVSPATATLMEGHGTSTRVGDVVEVQSISEVLSSHQLAPHSVALGSVKSNFGHLKSAAGAAGILKTVLALHDKVLPPSVNCERPNPDIDFAHSPLFVNQELRDWATTDGTPRRAGVSAFGFGGTNFHAVLEEYIPGNFEPGNGKHAVAVSIPAASSPKGRIAAVGDAAVQGSLKSPVRGVFLAGADSVENLIVRLTTAQKESSKGLAFPLCAPSEADLLAPERVAIDYGDISELTNKLAIVLRASASNQPAMWKALRAQGIFRGHGPAPKVAFLYTGQGSQYVNMLRSLRETEPIVADTFAEADRVMAPILGKPLTSYIFVEHSDASAVEKAEDDLKQTAITQPAVLAVDMAMTRLLAAYGIEPDMAMGHSLGEYGALVASGALPFAEALEAVSARGREMTRVSVADKGAMAAVFAPIAEIERILHTLHGYVVIANVNSGSQAVIGGATDAVAEAVQVFLQAGFNAVPLPVSHAFHTSIVASASEPLRQMLRRLHLQVPRIPVVANVNGQFYPTDPGAVARMTDILARQVASPVQFVTGLQTLYAAGTRVFVEVGPKKALQGFADDVLGHDPEVVSLFTNHPKFADNVAFNQALCGLYASGLGRGTKPESVNVGSTVSRIGSEQEGDADTSDRRFRKPEPPAEPVVITGAALGLPGTEHIFDDGNVARILNGEQFIDVIPTRFREAMLDKHIMRLVKSDNGGPVFESIDDVKDVIKLAGRGRGFDLDKEFGIPAERIPALDRTTQLAIAVGLDALRDAGLPLVMRYKATTKGTQLPDRWGLPDALRDDTGVIFASVFPGYDAFAHEMARYYSDRSRREQKFLLQSLRDRASSKNGDSVLTQEIQRRIDDLDSALQQHPYQLDRRFLLRALSMGHSQFAEFIGARGPNTQLNAACASTTQAIGVAEDWIRARRCRRVIIISADDITTDHLVDWFGAAFLASGAAATDEVVAEAAVPFDRRRHGMIIGMGAAAMVLESGEAARERGIQPICEVLSTITANSAFHATRLSVDHIKQVMEKVIVEAETRHGIQREHIAPKLMFVSHETYTPARGGSASAEIHALRHAFGERADDIVIANTKGFTGHAMGTGIEDVVAVKALETGVVPPVANFKQVDPELGPLNLSKGGCYPIEYALRLGAGFGSQISMALLRWVRSQNGVRPNPHALGYAYRIADKSAWTEWLSKIAGVDAMETEVVHRTLRIRDQRIAARAADVNIAPVTAVINGPVGAVPEPHKSAPTSQPTAITKSALPVAAKESVKERVLKLVSEKTGYPVDMLDVDLDLEADLGVDTVKQAEVFAALRESYSIPRDPNLKLRDFPTLAHVIRFVVERRQESAGVPAERSKLEPAEEKVSPTATPVQPVEAAVPLPQAASVDVKKRILELVVEKTGYPEEMLDLDLDLEADLGVDTVKQAEMFAAIRETYHIPRDPNLKLRDFPTLAHVIQFVYSKRPDLAAPKPESTVSLDGAVPANAPSSVTPERSAPTEDSIHEKILEIVAEKTGYPKDMLDLDLDLEADLGIDTVKQAEMFAEVRAAYNIPRDPNLKLRDFPTLAHVIQFAKDRSSGKAPATAPPTGASTVTAPPRPPLAGFEAANQIPRRVPCPALRPPLNLSKTTGVTLGPNKRVVIAADRAGVATELHNLLLSSGVEVMVLDPSSAQADVEAKIATWTQGREIDGVYWLPALDDEGQLARMQLSEWREALRARVKLLFVAMKLLYGQIATPGSFLVCGTRLGGQHGYDALGACAPMGGAIAGFAKAFKRERPEALVKAVDFAPDADPHNIAQSLIDETVRDPGAVEIGYRSGLRWTIGLQDDPTSLEPAGMILDKDTVFVVTGAAGSIVSAITTDLAAASGGTFYLLDLVPEPLADDPDLKRFASDREGLKRELFARMQARGERATPALVERELAALERSHAALSAIRAVEASGGRAHYCSLDLRAPEAVNRIIDQIRKTHGRIDVLLHAAGIERSHMLSEKSLAEFDLVFDVKADGWFNLFHAIADMPVGVALAFSSIAGRFGNAGQADYSAANDLLCKLTSHLRHTRPSTRAIAIDWTAWAGMGMASRGSIPKMMELAGIDMLQSNAGVPIIRRELTMHDSGGELVIANRLGVLMNEFDETGGIQAAAIEPQPGPMVGRVTTAGIAGEFTFETVLDPQSQPFLYDHKIDGVAVLPGVMGLEAFAEAALLVAPGKQIDSIEDVNFLAPFKFYRNEPRTLTLQLNFREENGSLIANCALIGSRKLAAQSQPQFTTHFTARVRLKQELSALPLQMFRTPKGLGASPEDIYKIFFHGPAYQVLEQLWLTPDRAIGKMARELPTNHVPPQLLTAVSPRIIELCFQAAGVWEIAEHRRMALPMHIDIVRPRQIELKGNVYSIVTRGPDPTSFDAHVVDEDGTCVLELQGYKTVSLPGAVDAQPLKHAEAALSHAV